jgi:hypothetical protein
MLVFLYFAYYQLITARSQEVKKNVFQEFDYGSASASIFSPIFLPSSFPLIFLLSCSLRMFFRHLDEKHYNQPTPPAFSPSLVTIPTALFSGGNDSLADPKDVAVIAPMLKNVVYTQFEASYAHLDFVCLFLFVI